MTGEAARVLLATEGEGRVVRSSQTREETATSADGREGQVTVGNELPGAQQQNKGAGDNSNNDR